MLYIGYQLEIEEAYRILRVPIDDTLSFWKQVEILREYCNKPGISITVYAIKNYCAFLGIKYEEINNVWDHHSTVGVCITRLLSITQTIKNNLDILGSDMALVTMKYVEGEEYTVRNPEPVIINWD